VILDTAPSNEEIYELDAFLMSDATPDDCMDIVTLDGLLTAFVIGPELVPPSVWLPLAGAARRNPSSSFRHRGRSRPSALADGDPPPILAARDYAGERMVWSSELGRLVVVRNWRSCGSHRCLVATAPCAAVSAPS
jgi:hypothetical protein